MDYDAEKSRNRPADRGENDGLFLLLISIHGLIRGENLELGRDADTGGQIKYVLELTRALAQQPEVAQVTLLTRRIEDAQVDEDYAQPVEELGPGARIVRLDAGPAGYLPKETLWDYLETFTDNALSYLRSIGKQPDLVHSHYADGGYVGSRLSHQLGVPLIHTGHSLGRVKRRRLLAAGLDSGRGAEPGHLLVPIVQQPGRQHHLGPGLEVVLHEGLDGQLSAL